MLNKIKNKRRVSYAKAVFGKKEINAVKKVLSTPMIIAGPYVKEFERRIANLFGKGFGVMTNSGSSANLIALELLNLPAGSEIITPVLTFGTTVSPILQKGLIPIFVDVVPGAYQIDISKIEEMITPKTKALFVPSLIGNIPDYKKLREIARKHNLYLVEDSCDTLGAKINGQPTGVYSDISTTSFYASHIITAGGSGGMVCFHNKNWLNRAKTLVGWGRSSAKNETEDSELRFSENLFGVPYDSKFIFEELGYNFQATDINGAFGLAQLDRLEEFSKKRRKNFVELFDFFKQHEKYFILPEQNSRVETNWLAFPLTIRKESPFSRVDLVKYLEANNIQTRPIFTGNAVRQPAFSNIKTRLNPAGYPVADEIMRGSFLIGCHHGLEDEDIEYIKDVFTQFLHV